MSWRPTYIEKRKQLNSKILKFGTLFFGAIMLLSVVLYMSFCLIGGKNQTPKAEKLIGIKREVSKPFRLTFKGNPPLGFASTRHANHRYPDNIQDVIGETNQLVPQYQPRTDNDPFYLYKPDDPSDINLLATTGFRFSPPVWSNLRPIKRHQVLARNRQVYQGDLVKPHGPKKMVILLNLYHDDVKGSQSKINQAICRNKSCE